MLNLTKFIASIIKNSRKKNGRVKTEFYYLTPKQVTLFWNLWRNQVARCNKSKDWCSDKWSLIENGNGEYTLYRNNLKYTVNNIHSKSCSILKEKNGKLEAYWINCEGGAFLRINK